jgi:hypothetical protein
LRASKDARQGAGPVSFEARYRSHLRMTGIHVILRSPRNAGVSKDKGLNPRHRLFDRGKRRIGLGAIGTAGLRHVGPAAAALAAERF